MTGTMSVDQANGSLSVYTVQRIHEHGDCQACDESNRDLVAQVEYDLHLSDEIPIRHITRKVCVDCAFHVMARFQFAYIP